MSENGKMHMFEVLFGNIERKLKWLAVVTLILGIVGSVIVLLVFATYEEGDYFITGLIIGAAWIPVSLITSWLIYAFADLVENTKAINTKESNRLLKIGVSARSSGKEKKEGSTVASKKVEDTTAKGDTKKDSGEAEPACSQKSEVDSNVKKVHISGPRKGQVICPNCGKTQSAYQENCWNCGALFVFGDE